MLLVGEGRMLMAGGKLFFLGGAKMPPADEDKKLVVGGDRMLVVGWVKLRLADELKRLRVGEVKEQSFVHGADQTPPSQGKLHEMSSSKNMQESLSFPFTVAIVSSYQSMAPLVMPLRQHTELSIRGGEGERRRSQQKGTWKQLPPPKVLRQ